MGNRADRRASAKIARQAIRRAKAPTEAAILRGAVDFVTDGPSPQLRACLSNADFDEAWSRLTDDLHDILQEEYPDFLTHAYAEAGLGGLEIVGGGAGANGLATRLFLLPVCGPPGRLSAFAEDADEITRLAASLRESGVVAEEGRCLVVPLVLPMAAFAPDATPPGRVRVLHDLVSSRLAAVMSGGALPPTDGLREAFGDVLQTGLDKSRPDAAFGAFVGIEAMPHPPRAGGEISEEDIEAEDVAKAAAIDSWHDTYAAEVADIAIGGPLDWPACAAALAWEVIRVPMEAALRRHSVPDGRPDAIHCAASGDGGRLVVSATAGIVAVGPFSAPSSHVWLDADEFFARAEASAETFVEHDDEGGVIAPLLGESERE